MEEEGRLSRRAVEGLEELLPRAVSPSFDAGDVLLCAHSAPPSPRSASRRSDDTAVGHSRQLGAAPS